ncbi:rCG51100 [Rattus norvegicus]|uniref:RCG51100 n=1 Tax=Rattus norvegicus TaxID=10116 RepID=A6IZ47_RAT|nr:rCG51100 [Rattus norvegicus]
MALPTSIFFQFQGTNSSHPSSMTANMVASQVHFTLFIYFFKTGRSG